MHFQNKILSDIQINHAYRAQKQLALALKYRG